MHMYHSRPAKTSFTDHCAQLAGLSLSISGSPGLAGATPDTQLSHCVQAKLERALQPRMHRVQVYNCSCHNPVCCSHHNIALAASDAMPQRAHPPSD